MNCLLINLYPITTDEKENNIKISNEQGKIIQIFFRYKGNRKH